MLIGILVQGGGEGVAGKYSFRCDLHPQVKRKAYVMDAPRLKSYV
jgi:hypothetical protein